VGLALFTALFLLWANLAVGIIGSEDNPANWMYVGVLAIFIIGALLARFQPRRMEKTLYVTALAQVLVTVIALATGLQREPESSVLHILAVNGFFIALWIGSAFLFRLAAGRDRKRGQ
jgi:peptidoglycan/LPS O-acetylase OafA/YrhL